MKAKMHAHTPTVHARRRFAAYLLVGLLSFAMAAPTFAQAYNQPASSESWWQQNLGRQLASLLDSPIESNKLQGLQHCLHFGTLYSDEIDLSAAAPKLLDIFDNDEEEGYRIMALSALHVIGDAESMFELLERIDQETSPRVRRLLQAALVSYARDHRYFRESLYFQENIARLAVAP